MAGSDRPTFAIIGGGLGGALMACYLGEAGYSVDVYEMRGDPRSGKIPAGRSINLALSHRGIVALERVGLAERVLKHSVPMYGRVMHSPTGELSFQRYGKDDRQAINSVSRAGLNLELLNAAEAYDTVRLHFNHKCVDLDFDDGRIEFERPDDEPAASAKADIIIGADGAFSAVRSRMLREDRYDFSQTYLKHSYKELSIPAGDDGGFRMDKNALHIWPRQLYMMIALPNVDGSFTCTIFWPLEGPNSFAALTRKEDVVPYFEQNFPDAVPVMPTLSDEYMSNPTSFIVTIRTNPWYLRDRVVMIGDACHAVVPFYGQGANASFEDVLVLSECMERHKPDWQGAFAEYDAMRRQHVNVLADMAVKNFIEMRDHTGSKLFLLRKKWEHLLHKRFPKWYLPLYTMATFTRIPYGAAVRRAKLQDRIVTVIAAILLVVLLVSLVSWMS